MIFSEEMKERCGTHDVSEGTDRLQSHAREEPGDNRWVRFIFGSTRRVVYEGHIEMENTYNS